MFVDTNSNNVPRPLIFFVKPKFGTSVLSALNLYCSALIPLTVSFLTGRPTTPLAGNAEFKTLINFYNVYKKINPDVVHHITLKPVIYGSIIAKLLRIRGVVNAISGLGYNFTTGRQSFVQKAMLYIMRFGFSRKNLVIIFQNENDQEELTDLGIIKSTNEIVRIKGSGVDLQKYFESPFTMQVCEIKG